MITFYIKVEVDLVGAAHLWRGVARNNWKSVPLVIMLSNVYRQEKLVATYLSHRGGHSCPYPINIYSSSPNCAFPSAKYSSRNGC
jgi:hypothetical protein